VAWLGSIAVNAIVLILLGSLAHRHAAPRRRTPISIEIIDARSTAVLIASAGGNSGGGTAGGAAASATHDNATTRSVASTSAKRSRQRTSTAPNAWTDVSMRVEQIDNGNGTGIGNGTSIGNGIGNGTGIGNGFGIAPGTVIASADDIAKQVPAPPAPPSRARPAKLIYPSRNLDVEDETHLFIARVTVDTEGTVVGARFVKTHPGSRGEHAANAIWSFRYLPALDDGGAPIRSTFEQEFQIR